MKRLVLASTIIDEIQDGDLVDFGAYGELYVVNPDYNDKYFWVTDDEEERDNPRAQGWTISKELAERVVEHYNEYYEDDEDGWWGDEDYTPGVYDVMLGDTVGIYSESDESDESLESILSELRDGGFDTSDIYEIQMGLGAYLGYDSEDIKEIVNDLISNGLVDIYSNTSSTDD